jgi:iron(II)-dependent oxidoreductase
MKSLIIALAVNLLLVSAAAGSDHEPVTHNAAWTPLAQVFDGVPMVLVPAGCFLMGSTPEQVEAAYAAFVAQFGEDAAVRQILETEMPRHEQCFEQPFWIDQYPVTQADFARLGGRRSAVDRFLGENRPVEVINWFEARDFCAARGARLPSEAEWEYAARGPDNLIYPWGDTWDETQLVWNRDEAEGTAEVGSIESGASWVGAYDLTGNVWEWTATIHDPDRYPYPYNSSDGRDTLTSTDDKRVLRGGAWSSVTLAGFRAAYRVSSRPQSRYYSLGFRCVRPAE